MASIVWHVATLVFYGRACLARSILIACRILALVLQVSLRLADYPDLEWTYQGIGHKLLQ